MLAEFAESLLEMRLRMLTTITRLTKSGSCYALGATFSSGNPAILSSYYLQRRII